MACEGNYSRIPINIKKDEIKRFSKNLSHFTYDFSNISKIEIQKGDSDGIFYITNIKQKDVANLPTIGKLDLLAALFFMNSVNKYSGKMVDIEIVLVFRNNEGTMLFMFIPIEKVESTSKSAKWFSQFAGFVEKETNQEISVNNFNFNDIIPQDSFISYKSTIPYLRGCTTNINIIFFEKSLTIKYEDYDKLVNIFGNNNYGKLNNIEELNNTSNLYDKNVINYKIKEINPRYASFDYQGTRNGPGLRSSNETLPLVCTPIEDEKGESVSGGTRLDWIKGSFESISPETKNIFYLILIVGILIGAMVFLHSFIFKNIGKLLGDEAIVTRSSSLT